jgi:hypothetical protein
MNRPLFCLLVPALLTAAPTPKSLSPAGTVQRQIELFNAHDLEGFMALFAEDLEVAELPRGPIGTRTKAWLWEVYAERFKTSPDLHASEGEQMVSGEFVIQKERIKGRADQKESVDVTLIYRVKAGKIDRVWTLLE